MKRTMLFLALSGLVGCGLGGRYIAPDVKGDTPLAVENTSGGDICQMILTVAGSAPDSTQHNLLYSTLKGDLPLKIDEKATFKLKPGRYDLYVASCQRGFESNSQLDLRGPTYLSIGPARTVPAGFARVSLSSGPLQQCTNTGTMSDGYPCCSGRHHFDSGLQEQVCEE